MRIGIAQIKLTNGNIDLNINKHTEAINEAIRLELDMIFFSELSLTHYEPSIAKEKSIHLNDRRLEIFQELSDKGNIIIALGAPTKFDKAVQISMIIFSPFKSVQKYSKQILHEDELSFFVKGNNQVVIDGKGHKVVPGICYESVQDVHLENAIKCGADIYISSVAKSERDVVDADKYFSKASKKYSIPILMVNGIGHCDNFNCGGKSAIWNAIGDRVIQLECDDVGIIFYDTELNLFEQHIFLND